MCNGAESRGNINGEVVTSKVENYHEERMRNIEVERVCNFGTSFLQCLHLHLNALLPTISISEVGITSFTLPLVCELNYVFLMFS